MLLNFSEDQSPIDWIYNLSHSKISFLSPLLDVSACIYFVMRTAGSLFWYIFRQHGQGRETRWQAEGFILFSSGCFSVGCGYVPFGCLR